MKRILLIACTILALTACQNNNSTPAGEYELKLVSSENMTFGAEGGSGEIIYEIVNPSSTLNVSVETSQEWIHIESTDSPIIFNVEENPSENERTGNIIVKYGNQSFNVSILQAANEDIITFTATTLAGSEYFGIYESEGYNYYISLSTAGVSDNGNLYSYSTYYYFDIYSDIPAEGSVINIPAGEYTLQNSTAPGSIYTAYSNLTLTEETTYEEIPFTEARMIVSENSIEAFVTLTTGEKHHIIYNGAPVIGQPGSEGVSTLTSDHNFNIEGGVFVGAYVGDMFYTGCNTCQVYLFEYLDEITGEERGDQFQLDLQLPLGGTDICGTYTPGTDVGDFIPGYADNSSGQYLQQHTWYMTAGYIDFAPMVAGTITVSKDDNDIYTFLIDCIDDKGYRISGTFKGKGQFIEW